MNQDQEQAIRKNLAAIFSDPQYVESLPEDHPLKKPGQDLGSLVTIAVDLLRKDSHPIIEDLMGLVWDIVGHRIVPVAVAPGLPRPTFAMLGRQAIILIPLEWEESFVAEPAMAFGALIFAGSHARDYYRGLLTPANMDTVILRALAYEAVFIKTLEESGCALNDYQKSLLEKFPQGIEPTGLAYKSGSFTFPSA